MVTRKIRQIIPANPGIKAVYVGKGNGEDLIFCRNVVCWALYGGFEDPDDGDVVAMVIDSCAEPTLMMADTWEEDFLGYAEANADLDRFRSQMLKAQQKKT